MSEQKIIGEVHGIKDYHAIARARADELKLTREGLDRLAGFAHGHAAKMLAQFPLKGIGPQSFGILNGALGLKLLVVEDPAAMQAHEKLRASNQRMRPERDENDMLSTGRDENSLLTMPALRARIISRQCQKANRARNAKLSPEARSRLAREAAVARWSRLDAVGRKKAMRRLAKGYRAHVKRRREGGK